MTTTASIQRTFRTYEQKGWPGQLARSYAPHAYDSGVLHVPTGTGVVAPQPSYPVLWDATNNRFRLPASDADQQLVCGVLSFDSSTIPSTMAVSENSAVGVQYADGSIVKVGVLGVFYAIAAEAMEYGDPVEWEWRTSSPTVANGEQKWKKRATVDFGATSPALPAAGDTGGLPTTGDFGAAATQTTVKAAIDGVISDLRDQVMAAVTSVYRLPIAVASPQPVAANDLVELRVGYQVR